MEGNGIGDLGRGARVFGVMVVEGGEDVIEEGLGLVDGEPAVKAAEGGVVGGGGEEGQADKPAAEEIGGEDLFELAVGKCPEPGANNLGADQEGNGEGWRGARTTLMVKGGAGQDDGGGVVDLGECDKRMETTAGEHALLQVGGQPGEDGRPPAGQHEQDTRRERRQVGVVG